MTCPKSDELALYAGGEAALRRIPKVARHVRACPECARTVSEFRLIRSAVASSGSVMRSSARQQMRARILERIACEPAGRAGGRLFQPLLRVACALSILCASLVLAGTLFELRSDRLPLIVAFGPPEAPAQAYRFSSRPASGLKSTPSVSARSGAPSTLEAAGLSVVDRPDGFARVVQLRLPAADPNLEIHWIMN